MKKTCVLLSVLALNDAQGQLPEAVRVPAYSGMHANTLSFTGNQAVLASTKKFSGSLFAERKFMLPELSQYMAGALIPTRSGNFGLLAGYAGNGNCNTSQFGLAYGLNLGKIDAGLQFNYHGMQVNGYGSASAITFDAGLIIPITDRLRSGLQIQNPTRSKLGKAEAETLPIIYSAGIGYDASEKIFMGAEARRIEDQPVDITGLLHYKFADQLAVRFGISSATSAFFFGAGFSLNRLQLDVITTMHPQLGITPALMLTFPK